MFQYDRSKLKTHIFVCTNERSPEDPRGCCQAKGSDEILTALKKEVTRRSLKGKVRAQRCGCLDACANGPSVVVYPEGQWYGQVSVEDVPQILDDHGEAQPS